MPRVGNAVVPLSSDGGTTALLRLSVVVRRRWGVTVGVAPVVGALRPWCRVWPVGMTVSVVLCVACGAASWLRRLRFWTVGLVLARFLDTSVEVLNRWAGVGETLRGVGLGAGQPVRVWRGWGSTVQGLKRRRHDGDAVACGPGWGRPRALRACGPEATSSPPLASATAATA